MTWFSKNKKGAADAAETTLAVFQNAQHAIAERLLDDGQKNFLNAWFADNIDDAGEQNLYVKYNLWKWQQAMATLAENKIGITFNQDAENFKPLIADDIAAIPRRAFARPQANA